MKNLIIFAVIAVAMMTLGCASLRNSAETMAVDECRNQCSELDELAVEECGNICMQVPGEYRIMCTDKCVILVTAGETKCRSVCKEAVADAFRMLDSK